MSHHHETQWLKFTPAAFVTFFLLLFAFGIALGFAVSLLVHTVRAEASTPEPINIMVEIKGPPEIHITADPINITGPTEIPIDVKVERDPAWPAPVEPLPKPTPKPAPVPKPQVCR